MDEQHSPLSRRRFLKGSIALVSAGVLAACGGSGGAPAGSTTPAGGATAPPAPAAEATTAPAPAATAAEAVAATAPAATAGAPAG
jgi:hypothetical protein